MKIHLSCGTVYLKDYTNCDVKCEGHFLDIERPDLVKKNITTLDNYYKKNITREQIEKKIFEKEEVVVDMFVNDKKLPFPDESIEEIRLYQAFEHFTLPEAKRLLNHWRTKLIPRGKLYLDIPDLAQTTYLYVNAQTEEDKEWYTRLLFGSHKNKYGIHKMMYSRDSIAKLLYAHGYNDLKFYPNIHFYPAFGVEATKY